MLESSSTLLRDYGRRVQSRSRGAHVVITKSDLVQLGVYMSARSDAIIDPSMHVFLDPALGCTADYERSSVSTDARNAPAFGEGG